MSDLDKALEEILCFEMCCYWPEEDGERHPQIDKIKQAFIDAGWIPYRPFSETPESEKPLWWSKTPELMTVDEHKARTADLMTKEEWERQATKDGWARPDDKYVGPDTVLPNTAHSYSKQQLREISKHWSTPRMTGQEWYDRFRNEQDVALDAALDQLIENVLAEDNPYSVDFRKAKREVEITVDEMAKKASGIE